MFYVVLVEVGGLEGIVDEEWRGVVLGEFDWVGGVGIVDEVGLDSGVGGVGLLKEFGEGVGEFVDFGG